MTKPYPHVLRPPPPPTETKNTPTVDKYRSPTRRKKLTKVVVRDVHAVQQVVLQLRLGRRVQIRQQPEPGSVHLVPPPPPAQTLAGVPALSRP